jgi:hypothetical protein
MSDPHEYQMKMVYPNMDKPEPKKVIKKQQTHLNIMPKIWKEAFVMAQKIKELIIVPAFCY